MHLAIPGANANNSITGLHTIPHYNNSNCILMAMLEFFLKKGCEVVLCEGRWIFRRRGLALRRKMQENVL